MGKLHLFGSFRGWCAGERSADPRYPAREWKKITWATTYRVMKSFTINAAADLLERDRRTDGRKPPSFAPLRIAMIGRDAS